MQPWVLVNENFSGWEVGAGVMKSRRLEPIGRRGAMHSNRDDQGGLHRQSGIQVGLADSGRLRQTEVGKHIPDQGRSSSEKGLEGCMGVRRAQRWAGDAALSAGKEVEGDQTGNFCRNREEK